MRRSRSLVPLLVILLFIATIAGLVWACYQFAKNDVSGEGFSIQWIGIHSLISGGESPFSDTVTAKIQGSVAPQSGFVPGTAPKYTTPLFSGAVSLPFAMIGNKTISHGLWLASQLIAIFAILILGIRLTSWRPPWYIFLPFSIFTVFSYHVVIPWLDGGISIWSMLFFVLSLMVLSQKKYEVSGILLALSTMQPHMVILPIIFVLIWAASQRRMLVILWFFITVIFISVIGLFLVPDWIVQYFRIIIHVQQNFPPGSPGTLFLNTWPGLGRQLGWITSLLLGIIMLFEWWLALKKDFRWFIWTVCLTIVISQWIGIPTVPANLVVLLIPMLLIAAMLAERFPRGGDWAAVIFCSVMFVWEWALYYNDVMNSPTGSQLNLLIPLPLILFIGLYWVRWWAIKPRRLLVEEIRLGESY